MMMLHVNTCHICGSGINSGDKLKALPTRPAAVGSRRAGSRSARSTKLHHVAVLCLAMYPCFCAPKLHKIISRFTRRVFHGFLKDPKDLESVYKY